MAELTREEVAAMVEQVVREKGVTGELAGEPPEPPALPSGIEGSYVLAAREAGEGAAE
jgi:hypothetical protein